VTPRLRFGTGTTVKRFDTYREWLRVAEDAGFDLLTTGDSQSLWADPFVTMAYAAAHTSRPRLAITVSNPMTRHPAVVASSLVALDQISEGRFALGLSSGDSALRNIGVRPATVDELRAFVLDVRAACRGGLRWATADVPLWLAAEGPRTQRLAGAIADGVVLSNALTEEATERAFANLADGAASAGRRVEDLEVWWMANLVPAPTEAEGIHAVRSILAGTANHVFRFTMDGKGVPDGVRPALEALQREYDSSHHADPATAAANAELVDRYGLTEWLAAQSTIAGPVERCVERLHEVAGNGVTGLILSQFAGDPLDFMRLFAERIAPHFW
jgi:5,10-methylenetetrahydromethanopterin reductase